MSERISIIGGGVSGITTALALQLLGHETVVYAAEIVHEDAPEDPRFASLYPAASVIPHSVQTEALDRIFPPSQEIFEHLHALSMAGMKLHDHFEVFEFPVEPPPYASHMKNFRAINERPRKESAPVPRRPGIDDLYGWNFDCYVAEWPIYMKQLYELYGRAGGTVHRRKLTSSDIGSLEPQVVVNCAGIWSPSLFKDPEPRRVLKGHLVHVSGAPMIREFDRIPSYNYTPRPEVYSAPDNEPCDLYFYPRTGGWIVGGSRQKGIIAEDGAFEGTEFEEVTSLDGTLLPPQIIDINREIIEHTYGLDLGETGKTEVRTGLRYVRKFEGDGLRLEKSREYGKSVIHNYAHGGAGVTLSWGCALEVATLLSGIAGFENESKRDRKDRIVLLKQGLEEVFA